MLSLDCYTTRERRGHDCFCSGNVDIFHDNFWQRHGDTTGTMVLRLPAVSRSTLAITVVRAQRRELNCQPLAWSTSSTFNWRRDILNRALFKSLTRACAETHWRIYSQFRFVFYSFRNIGASSKLCEDFFQILPLLIFLYSRLVISIDNLIIGAGNWQCLVSGSATSRVSRHYIFHSCG